MSVFKLRGGRAPTLMLDPANRLHQALMRLERALNGAAPDGAGKSLAT
jgi:hypothetical protein